MPHSNLDKIYGQIESLPSLPAIVSQVMDVTANPESSAHDLMKAVLPDQSMCATILKIANSAFFGLPREVSSIEKAVMVLGFDEIKNIVLGKAVFNSFKELNDTNKNDVEKLWEHSFTCGLAAKVIAERIRVSPSQLFIAGLIHDIGKLAMLITFPKLYSHFLQEMEENWRDNCEKESENFFITHDEVAERILNKWLFPRSLVNAVGYHHRPEGGEDVKLFASIVQISDMISHITSNSHTFSTSNYRSLLLSIKPDLFDMWRELNLPCGESEIAVWFDLLQESKEKDTAILTIFSS
jgi:putative nucleotidyltransferase with HDIG domain